MLWVNGSAQNFVSADDRGLLFGDGCFSTLAKRNGTLERVDAHFRRLQRDVGRLSLPFADWPLLRRELTLFTGSLDDGIVRVSLTRGRGGSGYRCDDYSDCTRLMQWRPFSKTLSTNAHNGVTLFLCATRLARQAQLAGIKHCNRLEQVLARREWTDETYAEGLLCDSDGFVMEGTFSNIFWRDDNGQWWTPDLHYSGVTGIMREEILALMKTAGNAVRETYQLLPDTLKTIAECFVCNSVIGIWPVIALADKTLPIGELTRQLQQKLQSQSNINGQSNAI